MEELSDYELLSELRERPQRIEVRAPTSNAKTERQYWLELTVKMLKKPWPMIAKKVEGWPMEWVRDLYVECTRAEVENGAALWWWKIKNPKT